MCLKRGLHSILQKTVGERGPCRLHVSGTASSTIPTPNECYSMYINGCFGYVIKGRAWSRCIADSETFQILSSNHLETVRCTLELSYCILGVWYIKGTSKGVSYFRIQCFYQTTTISSLKLHISHTNGSGMFAEGWQGLTQPTPSPWCHQLSQLSRILCRPLSVTRRDRDFPLTQGDVTSSPCPSKRTCAFVQMGKFDKGVYTGTY